MFTLLTTRGGESYLPNPARMPYLDQGTTNGCGTTSLAMAMTYLGVQTTREQVDEAIRRTDILSAPGDLMRYATAHGVRAQDYNNGVWEDIVAEIMMGNPCICLVYAKYEYPRPRRTKVHGFHYVVINGYRLDAQRSAGLAVFHDPNVRDDSSGRGFDVETSVENFESVWSEVGWGFRNYYIAVAPEDGFFANPRDRTLTGSEGTTATLDGVADLFNGFERIKTGSVRSVCRGIGQVVGGSTEIIGAGICAITQLAGNKLNDAVEDIPVVRNIIQPIGDALNAGGAVGSDLVEVFGDVTEDGGRCLGSLLVLDFAGAGQAAVDSVKDTATGVVEALSDACDGLKDAISDFFQSASGSSSGTGSGSGGGNTKSSSRATKNR